jgi:hypothetical protein
MVKWKNSRQDERQQNKFVSLIYYKIAAEMMEYLNLYLIQPRPLLKTEQHFLKSKLTLEIQTEFMDP